MKTNNNIVIESAKIMWRNLSGEEGQYNAKGKRNFCVELDEGLAKMLARDGWNVKQLLPKEGVDADPKWYMQVHVRFDIMPPNIVLITSNGKTKLSEENINIVDWAEIENVDLIIRPYDWKMTNGQTGRKAYVKSMYITIVEDELEKKYANVPDSAQNSIANMNMEDDMFD